MALISTKGRMGFLLQSNRLGYLSKDGSPSPDAITYYPTGGNILTFNATTVDVSPQIDQRMLEAEIGGTMFPTGAYRAGYNVAGSYTLQPRMEDTFGWILYALSGAILSEYEGTGIGEHSFMLDESSRAGNLPWLSFFKYLPGIGPASDALEVHEDSRIISAVLNIPAAGLMTVDINQRARVFGINGAMKFVDRSSLIGPKAPTSATTMSTTDSDGTVNTLIDSTANFVGLVGMRVYIDGVGWRTIVSHTTTEITFSPAASALIATGTDYLVDAPMWAATTADTTATTLTDSAASYAVDSLVGAGVYIEGVGWRTVTTNTATVITFEPPAVVVSSGAMYALGAQALGGNIRQIYVQPDVYAAVNVNDWISILGKGTRRVNQKVVDSDGNYVLRVDGEMFEECENGDYYIILDSTHPTGGTLTSVVDSAAFTTDDLYKGHWIEVWDANGDSVGMYVISGIVAGTTTAHVDGSFALAPTSAMAYAIFMEEVDVNWLEAECPITIPKTSIPESVFKTFKEPFAGRKLPVRQLTVNYAYQALDAAQEMLVGAYEQDDITVQGASAELRYTYRVRSHELFSLIATGGSITQVMRRFSPDVFKSDSYFRCVSPQKITGTNEVFGIEGYFPETVWELQGAPRLQGNDIVELEFVGRPVQPCGTNNPIYGPMTLAADANIVTGALTHADLDALSEDDVIGKFIRITSGNGAGQVRFIAGYRDGTSEGTVIPQRPWITAPATGDTFVIESHYSVITITNSRSTPYGDDVPQTP